MQEIINISHMLLRVASYFIFAHVVMSWLIQFNVTSPRLLIFGTYFTLLSLVLLLLSLNFIQTLHGYAEGSFFCIWKCRATRFFNFYITAEHNRHPFHNRNAECRNASNGKRWRRKNGKLNIGMFSDIVLTNTNIILEVISSIWFSLFIIIFFCTIWRRG